METVFPPAAGKRSASGIVDVIPNPDVFVLVQARTLSTAPLSMTRTGDLAQGFFFCGASVSEFAGGLLFDPGSLHASSAFLLSGMR